MNPASTSAPLTNGLQSGWTPYQYQVTDLVFVLLVALLSTLVGYQFAAGNQLEQLPLIMRQLHPDYLARDFFLNTADSFGPRSYYVMLLGWICQWLPISWAYLGLTYLTDLALAAVTLWVAGVVLKSSRAGALLAVVMTLGLTSFHLGDATQIRYEVFQPASLALPLTLAALGCGLLGQPIRAALLAAVASLPHPLYGAEGGGIALGLAFVALVLSRDIPLRDYTRADLAWRPAILYTLLGALVLAAALAFFWLLPYQAVVAGQKLPTDQFFHILAYFRAPHHYLPSHFRLNDYISGAAFVAMAALCLGVWGRRGWDRRLLLVSMLMVVVLACCVLGYLFAELWPQRAALTLQLFRLLSLLKWVGYLLLGAVLAEALARPREWLDRPLAAFSLVCSGVAQPIITAMNLLLLHLRPWHWLRGTQWLVIAGAGLITLVFNLVFGSPQEALYLLFALALVGTCLLRQWRYGVAYGIALVGLCTLLGANHGAALGIRQAVLAPVFSLADHSDEDVRTAREIGRQTPPSALLIVPPHMGIVRVIGERALVVDYKSIPFQDAAMLEWYDRMQRVYGKVEGGGFEALQQMDDAYRGISQQQLMQLARRYGADYALLYSQTATGLPVVFKNQAYQLVRL